MKLILNDELTKLNMYKTYMNDKKTLNFLV